MNPRDEKNRLEEATSQEKPWKKWGPYLSDRQWATVREDYSIGESPWEYFTHDMARSRAYRWGEDGIAGICDEQQTLCFALCFWNERDPILKERYFGLTNHEGNHGEDVKELYFYLDNTPTHSYMKCLYKYSQQEYPYVDLIHKNETRSKKEGEYELVDTGIFDGKEYFDIFIEYAKNTPTDILIKITVINRSHQASRLHLLPTLWFRNTWVWQQENLKPFLKEGLSAKGQRFIESHHYTLGSYYLQAFDQCTSLFTENETNEQKLSGKSNASPYVKDAFHDYLIHNKKEAVNPKKEGTKAALHYLLQLEGGASEVIFLRLTDNPVPLKNSLDSIVMKREKEADQFYSSLLPKTVDPEKAKICRQALAGMCWNKQYYYFDALDWLKEHQVNPLEIKDETIRNKQWFHMVSHDIISMPDKWEYPWYACWDLAFHALAFSLIDIDFAKKQLSLLLSERYLHPTGQLPAYEWNFNDVNPPVHAWACLFLHRLQREQDGHGDLSFLKQIFNKLLINFTWWVNRKDLSGKNVFEGGFLGLDNIGLFDRSAPLPIDGRLEQADGTAWMVLYCLNMLEMAAEIAAVDSSFENIALKFVDHFFFISSAMNRIGPDGSGLWDEEDGFYYDLIRTPDGRAISLKVRSIVGLLPLCSITCIEPHHREKVPYINQYMRAKLQKYPELAQHIHPIGPQHRGCNDRSLLALLDEKKLRRILTRMLDEKEFLSPYGIRSLSRYHLDHPYLFNLSGKDYELKYEPAESESAMFGGNSNWRGPIWFPLNGLIIRGLLQFYLYYGDHFTVEFPTGSGHFLNLYDVAKELTKRLTQIFLPDEKGHRPVHGDTEKFQNDPDFKELLLFYEYFNAETGQGLGASHQTGWTGIISLLISFFENRDGATLLQEGKKALFTKPIV